MSSNSSSSYMTVEPVFVLRRDIPQGYENRPTVLEVCVAAENTSGRGTILGSQPIGGLWRIYPNSREARNALLLQDLTMRQVKVKVTGTNPYLFKDDRGVEVPTTKVWIDEIPISVSNKEIELSLKRLGCELRSDIKMERARDNDRLLTRFLTGRRFVFITVPSTPLDKTMPVGGLFKAKIFHKEQKTVKLFCSRCLQDGHNFSQCNNDIVCRVCRLSGHRSGDSECAGGRGAPPTDTTDPSGGVESSQRPETSQASSEGGVESVQPGDHEEGQRDQPETPAAEAGAGATLRSKVRRGRTEQREPRESQQRTLTGMAFGLMDKARSASKRRGSPDAVSRSPKAAKRVQATNDRKEGKGERGEEKQREEKGEGEKQGEDEYFSDEGEEGEDKRENEGG